MSLVMTRERVARGWSRQELAGLTRLSPADIGKIESGRFVPYAVWLSAIAQALDWPADRAIELLEEDTTHGDH